MELCPKLVMTKRETNTQRMFVCACYMRAIVMERLSNSNHCYRSYNGKRRKASWKRSDCQAAADRHHIEKCCFFVVFYVSFCFWQQILDTLHIFEQSTFLWLGYGNGSCGYLSYDKWSPIPFYSLWILPQGLRKDFMTYLIIIFCCALISVLAGVCTYFACPFQ